VLYLQSVNGGIDVANSDHEPSRDETITPARCVHRSALVGCRSRACRFSQSAWAAKPEPGNSADGGLTSTSTGIFRSFADFDAGGIEHGSEMRVELTRRAGLR
jgi:hypothetical protein